MRALALWLAGGLAAASLALPSVATSAETLGALSLQASRSSVEEGATLRLSGEAPRTRAGDVVRLQTRTAGRWDTIARTTARQRGTFSFALTESRGTHRYRTVLPSRGRQPRLVSSAVPVEVFWRPAVDVSAESILDPDRGSLLVIEGTVEAPVDSVTLQRREGEDGTWSDVEDDAVEDGAFSFAVRDLLVTQFRVVTPASGLRHAAKSAVIANERAPFAVDLSSGWGIYFVDLVGLQVEADAASIVIPNDEADEEPWTLSGVGAPGVHWTAKIVDPSGAVIGSFTDETQKTEVLLDEVGDYVVRVDQVAGDRWTLVMDMGPTSVTTIGGEPVTPPYPLMWSVAFYGRAGQQVSLGLGGPCINPDDVVPGQSFAGHCDHLFDSRGNEIVGTSREHPSMWTLPADGAYLFLADVRSDPISLLEPDRAAVDGSTVEVPVNRTGGVGYVELHAEPGSTQRVSVDAWDPSGESGFTALVTTSDIVDTLTSDHLETDVVVPDDGTFYVFVTRTEPGTVSVSFSPVD